MDQIEQNVTLPKSYILSVISIGVTLIIILIYSGYNDWPFIPTVMLGAVAQTLFRITKRVIKNKIQKTNTDTDSSNEEISNLSAIKTYGLIYIIMLFVTALWVGVGIVIGKVF